jgi:polysaccharide export outer membrane protein
MFTRRTLLAALPFIGGAMAAFPAPAKEAQPEAPLIRFSDWSDEEPLYLLYPGDKLEVTFPSAIELNRTTQVGPDGRITLPMIGQVMAAYKSVPQLQADIQSAFTPILRNPLVDMDALQAVLAAGGFLHSAKTHKVVLIRRGRDGQAMRRVIDVQDMLAGRERQMIALRRFDIIYVPRTNVAEAGVWVEQWVNNLIPGGILNYFTYRTFN